MARKRKQRRQSHGSAWHWQQTDCWYFTRLGTKQRVALFDENGERIRGKENKQSAERALAREQLSWDEEQRGLIGSGGEWLVARVCSEYIQYCERGVANATISSGHRNSTVSWLNDLCGFCGALPVAQLKKGHVTTWLEQHTTWRAADTRRGVLSVVLVDQRRGA